MNRLTLKTSTIFIAKAGRTRVFHSLDEVPPKLRKQLDDSTNSFNSATILIADRKGRQEIVRALSGLPSALRSRVASSLALPPAVPWRSSGKTGWSLLSLGQLRSSSGPRSISARQQKFH